MTGIKPSERSPICGVPLVWGRAPSPVQAECTGAPVKPGVDLTRWSNSAAACGHCNSGFVPGISDIARLTAKAASAVALLCVVIVLLLTRSATAADLAILRNGFSIRHEHRLVMGATTRLFFGADDSSFTDVPTAEITGYEKDLSSPLSSSLPLPPPAHSPASIPAHSVPPLSAPALHQVVDSASAAYHLDPDLVNSVIHAESGFNAHAVSSKGARGLMQLMPGTANQLGVNDAFDPQSNVAGGSRYLRELLERYNFDLVKALAAYNAGPERVEQYRGVPPFRETQAYVARIVHEYNQKKIAQEKEAKQKQVASKTRSAAHPGLKPGTPKPASATTAAQSPR
jgi:soluble lytic murein transglycosylase-like protein